MDFSPYLRGIQQVPGKTPGEKLKSLNEFARKIANDASRGRGGPSTPEIHPTPDLPAVLIPLVRLEVAKILRLPEEIVAALKSGDSTLVSRVLACKWFFNGSLRDYTNSAYFVSHIFPHLSLTNRAKVIRSLAKYLNREDPTVAEEFYAALSEKYGNKQVEPLLLACRDTFIWSTVETRRLTLSICTVQRLYLRYPQIIVNYLKLVTTDAFNNQKFAQNLMVKFRKFLPHVFKHFPLIFIDILLVHKKNFDLKLNSKRTRHFFQQSEALDALLAQPNIFFPMLSRKIITKKLTRDQFKSILVKILPSYRREIRCSSESIFKHLEYFSDEEKILLFFSAFEERYGISYVKCNDAINPKIIIKLPQTLRVDVARRQIESGEKFNKYDLENSWVCYLPTGEAIQAIKNQIDVTSDSSSRSMLLKLLIYTCHVNNDKDALVEVLSYIATRHKNERGDNMSNFFVKFNTLFKTGDLTVEHWYWVMHLLNRLYVKNDLHQITVIQELLMKKIFFNVINHLPSDKDISFFIDISVKYPWCFWTVLEDQSLHLQRQCLDLIIRAVPSISDEVKHKKDRRFWFDCHILDNIYEFNKRIKTQEVKLEPMSPLHYDWLFEDIRTIISQPELNKDATSIKAILKKDDPQLYTMFLGEDKAVFDVFSKDAVNLLKKDDGKILKNWEIYYKKCREYINFPWTRLFIKSCRWYEDIPVKFVEKALKDFPESEDGRELIILALLIEGEKFEEIIEPFTPSNTALDVNDPDTKRKISINKSVMMAANVANDLLSSEVYLKYFNEDYLAIAQYHLKNRCKRAKVEDVFEIAEKLMEFSGVSIKKHGIRLFFAIATLDQQMKMMTKLVETEKHPSIRHMLCEIVRNNFISQPGSATFAIMCNCFEKMPLDDEDIVGKFINFDGISDQYIVEYFKIVLATIENPDKLINPTDRTNYISRMIACASTKIGCFFTEDYEQEFLAKYLANLSCKSTTASMCKYSVDNYIGLAGEKLQFRLNHFSDLLKEILKDTSNTLPAKKTLGYTANAMFLYLTEYILKSSIASDIKSQLFHKIFGLFDHILNPQQFPSCYMIVKLSCLMDSTDNSRETGAKIASILPHFVNLFTVELIAPIAQVIFDTIKILHSENFDSYFTNTAEYLLEHGEKLEMNLCATWLVMGLFDTHISGESFVKIIQVLNCCADCAVITKLALYREGRRYN